MNSWKIKQIKAQKLKNPILIEGLPGIGNVGKVAVDFITEEIGAKKIYEISSYSLPHSVFINEKNLVEMPKIEIYYKKGKDNDYLFLSGDVQPADEVSCYEFSEKILDLCRQEKCNEIITLGGIGLGDVPKEPKVYCTGNTKKAIDKYNDKMLHTKLYGVVGPIVGVSGLLLGMADRKTTAVALLAETYSHPMYLGILGAKEIVKFLNKKFDLNVKIEKLDKEIEEIEEEMMKRTEDLNNVSKQAAAKKFGVRSDVNYIG